MNAINVTKAMAKNLASLKEAKEAQKGWAVYQAEVEARILKEIEEQGVSLPVSGSLPIGEEWLIVCSSGRDFDQACLTSFSVKYPDMEGVLFSRTWKPGEKAVIDSFMGSAHPAVEEFKDCFKEKQFKPSFRAK